MKWLAANGTTIAMALVLSLVTVGLLTGPGENDPPVTLYANFRPVVRAEVGSLEYYVENKRYSTEIPVTVWADRPQISVIRLICSPILDVSKFSTDPSVRETTIEITEKDFNLTPDLANRIRIKAFTLRIVYAPMVTKRIPIEVSTLDVQDTQGASFRIDDVKAMPLAIDVRLPVDKATAIKGLPIRPISVSGRTKSFETEGSINTDLPDMKDVRALQPFRIEVQLSPIRPRVELAGVPLFLSCPAPPVPGMKAELVDRLVIKVILEGPENTVKELKVEHVHAYVKVDWGPGTADGTYPFQIKVDLGDEALRKEVRVELGPGEPRMAAVRITRNP